jgi:hypothetical protein
MTKTQHLMLYDNVKEDGRKQKYLHTNIFTRAGHNETHL